MCFKIILKVIKNQGSTISIEKVIFIKITESGWERGVNLTPYPPPPTPTRPFRDNKMQNVGNPELSQEKIQCFIRERFCISLSHTFFH